MSIPEITNNGNHLYYIENTAKNSAHKISKRNLATSTITEAGQTIDAKKQLIKHESPYLEVAKEVGISMIPIYGTIHEFQKGNIGWGIFSAVTDALSLIPVIGAGCKATGALIRGGETAIKGIEACVVTTESINTTAKIMAKEASQQLAKDSISTTSKELATASLRAVDPGLELLYKGSKSLTKRAIKLPEKGLVKAAKTSSTKAISAAETLLVATKNIGKNASLKSSKILEKGAINTLFKDKTRNIFHRSKPFGKSISNLLNHSKWHSFDKIEKKILAKEAQDLHKNFMNLRKGLLDVNYQFLRDLSRTKFVINGNTIAKGPSLKILEDVKTAFSGIEDNIRLFSAYGNQSILTGPQMILARKIKNFGSYGSSNAKTVYTAKTLDKGRLEFIAQYTADLHHTDKLKTDGLKSYGVQVKAILSQKKVPKLKYSYYAH
ncbi:hypothetical protein [Candidatus Liberibacter sp.]|uniref:hypothetical protein n=1 Tax=Candidatus Liberibacter sp. TaxID=34022 RepID=UPI0015F366D9|nr:hypothetical protein [Candidatus Liberibacter sp.]MBA5723779.1 hypothetical protein [Candidatus Liberibacter sp.]